MKIYKNKNVYEAAVERLDYVFEHFDNIYVSFSGGKDSGCLYHLVLKYMAERGIKRRIGLFHQDFEAQFQATSDYVEKVFTSAPDFVERFWCCIPQAAVNSLCIYEPYWYTWDDQKRDLWVRPRPAYDYVYTLENNPFDFYKYRMPEKHFHNAFNFWYSKHCVGGKTIALLGVRSNESLNRYAAISAKVHMYDNQSWTVELGQNCWLSYPLYDWTVEDIWTANGKFNFPYNKIYDLYYKAGIPIRAMRVASPFIAEGRTSLNIYRVIDPKMWAKLVGRVNGANFGAIYGKSKAVAYRDIKLPEGQTWESYTKYLLSTLPEETRKHYEKLFKVSMDFWHKTGGGMDKKVINEAKEKGYKFHLNGSSPYSKNRAKQRVIIDGAIPDDTDNLEATKDLPSWKRMCMCILKNDYTCRTMGFAPTKNQQDHINAIKDKYRAIVRGQEYV